jgi:hypothetical protein
MRIVNCHIRSTASMHYGFTVTNDIAGEDYGQFLRIASERFPSFMLVWRDQFSFKPSAGTTWKSRSKVAIANLKRYTGAPEVHLLAPLHCDPSDPRYTPIKDIGIVAVLPPGPRFRISLLLQDQGARDCSGRSRSTGRHKRRQSSLRRRRSAGISKLDSGTRLKQHLGAKPGNAGART